MSWLSKLLKTGDNSWLEQRNHNPRVGGSSPSSATTTIRSLFQVKRRFVRRAKGLLRSPPSSRWRPVHLQSL